MFNFTPKAGIIYNKTGLNFYNNNIAYEQMVICIENGMRFEYKSGNFNAYSNIFSITQNSISWYVVFAYGDSRSPSEEKRLLDN